MSTLADWEKLKKLAEQKREEAQRAEGRLQAGLKTLKQDHGCASIKEGKALLRQLEADEEKAQQAFDSAVLEFEETWKDALSSD